MSDSTRLDPRDHALTAPVAVTTTLDTQIEREDAKAARRGIRQLLPRRSAKLIIGLVLVLAIVAFGVLAPMFVQDPRYSGNDALQPPSAEHWLGTTKLGYDVFAQLAYGTRGSLMVGIIAALIALTLSIVFGILAGYIGGWGDEGLSLVTNIMLVIPGIPLAMVIATYFPSRSWLLVAFVLGITSWAGSAVVLRVQARSLRSRDYVAAARVAGEKPARVILVEILPNLLPLLAAQFLFAIIFAILGEAGLSYLGLGATDSITWGTILNDAQTGQALGTRAWWWFVPPGIMIALLGAGLSLINFSIDEIINPKLRLTPENARRVRKAKEAGKGVEVEAAELAAAEQANAETATTSTTSTEDAEKNGVRA
ncbi:ABC transporter permease [Microbacterium sp. W1N]|uniref:ABC transporter permease n=1 Tax=Microbacterium festucae TaxID=2977531 RepID=UPI0021C085AA|nr:ABC transporter permease [Microbacterium festucae]MCT9819281.1 ABC transporter permease [Microbacterium festucae]